MDGENNMETMDNIEKEELAFLEADPSPVNQSDISSEELDRLNKSFDEMAKDLEELNESMDAMINGSEATIEEEIRKFLEDPRFSSREALVNTLHEQLQNDGIKPKFRNAAIEARTCEPLLHYYLDKAFSLNATARNKERRNNVKKEALKKIKNQKTLRFPDYVDRLDKYIGKIVKDEQDIKFISTALYNYILETKLVDTNQFLSILLGNIIFLEYEDDTKSINLKEDLKVAYSRILAIKL